MFRNVTFLFILLFLIFQPFKVPAQNLKKPLFSSGKDLPAESDTLLVDHPKPEQLFFSISDKKEKLKIEWNDPLYPGAIDHYRLTIEGSDTSFETDGASHLLLIPRKMAYYHKKFTLEAIPSGTFTLPVQTVCYENPYSRFFNVRERWIAHRGLSARYPENTAIAFEMAADSGFSIVECDIRQTKDKIWVVNHDRTLDRTSTGSGYIKQFTLKEILRFNNGYPNQFGDKYPQQILTLAQFVTICKEKKIKAIIEIKDEKATLFELHKLVEMLTEQLSYEHFALQSFNAKLLKRIRRTDEKATLGLISDRFEPTQIETLNDLYPCFYNLKFNPEEFSNLTFMEQTITPILQSGCYLSLWKVNDPGQAALLMQKKLFVITDGSHGDRPDEKEEGCRTK